MVDTKKLYVNRSRYISNDYFPYILEYKLVSRDENEISSNATIIEAFLIIIIISYNIILI